MIRKGLLTSLLLLLLAGAALAQTADVPPGHWAYEAVQTLLSRGYLSTDAQGLFRGDEPVSRFDLAVLVARMLEDIQAGRVQVGTAADIGLLRRLESEFRAELVQWYAAREELAEITARTQRQLVVIDEQLNNILFELERIDGALQVAEGRLSGHDLDVAALNERLAQLSAQLTAVRSELQQSIEGLYAAVTDTLAAYGVAVDEQFAQQTRAYGDLAAQLAALQARIDEELVPLNNRLSEQGAAMFLRLNELDAAFKARTDELAAQLETVRQSTAELRAALGELQTALTEEYGARLQQQASLFSQDIAQVRAETSRLDEAVHRLQADVEQHRAAVAEHTRALETLAAALAALEQQTASDTGRFDNDVAELRAMLAMLDTSIQELRDNLRIVERHTATLTDAVRDVMTAADALRADVDTLQARMDAEYGELRSELQRVQEELATLQGVLGTSEEQIAALTERVRRELDEQLALTLAREQQLARQLADLQSEFSTYRQRTEEELQRTRSMGTLGIGAAILALLLGFAN